MDFEKSSSDIPNCCRLNRRFDDLNPQEHLANLPVEYANQHKATWRKTPRRKKWPLLNCFRDNDVETDVYHRWPEARNLFDDFPGRTLYAHISLLEPGGVLRVHRDGYNKNTNLPDRPQYPLFNCTLRFHIPLQTNDETLMYCDDRLYHMKEGECWMLNNFAQHAAVNNHSSIRRYHLIFDVAPNHETMQLLADAEDDLGYEDQPFFEKHWPEHLIQNS